MQGETDGAPKVVESRSRGEKMSLSCEDGRTEKCRARGSHERGPDLICLGFVINRDSNRT